MDFVFTPCRKPKVRDQYNVNAIMLTTFSLIFVVKLLLQKKKKTIGEIVFYDNRIFQSLLQDYLHLPVIQKTLWIT